MLAALDDPFDKGGRYLARRDPAEHLGWLLGLPLADLGFAGWLHTRALPFPSQPERICDTVAFVRDQRRGGVPWAIVLEFQLEPDPLLFGRLLVYLGRLWLEHKPAQERGDRFELGGVIVNLTGRGNCSRRMSWPEARLETGLVVVERNLAAESAAKTLTAIAGGTAPRGVLPYIPLMQGGAEAGIIGQWVALAGAETDARRRADDGSLALVFAEAAGCREVWAQALRGWNMIESKVVTEWQRQARVEERVEMVVELLGDKFGPLPAELASAIRSQTDLATLKRWGSLVLRAATLDQFRQDAQLP
jgi:hypothetical protein